MTNEQNNCDLETAYDCMDFGDIATIADSHCETRGGKSAVSLCNISYLDAAICNPHNVTCCLEVLEHRGCMLGRDKTSRATFEGKQPHEFATVRKDTYEWCRNPKKTHGKYNNDLSMNYYQGK